MTDDEYDASIRAALRPIAAHPDVERAARMAAELDIDTYTRVNYAIRVLEDTTQLTRRERRDIALLLRRWRKERYGSALTDDEQREGKAEIDP